MTRFDPTRYYRTTDPELSILATRVTLAQWRHRGEGPAYFRFGNRVLYEGRGLERLARPASRRTSVAPAGNGESK